MPKNRHFDIRYSEFDIGMWDVPHFSDPISADFLRTSKMHFWEHPDEVHLYRFRTICLYLLFFIYKNSKQEKF